MASHKEAEEHKSSIVVQPRGLSLHINIIHIILIFMTLAVATLRMRQLNRIARALEQRL
jgi:hypothetical protein